MRQSACALYMVQLSCWYRPLQSDAKTCTFRSSSTRTEAFFQHHIAADSDILDHLAFWCVWLCFSSSAFCYVVFASVSQHNMSAPAGLIVSQLSVPCCWLLRLDGAWAVLCVSKPKLIFVYRNSHRIARFVYLLKHRTFYSSMLDIEPGRCQCCML